MDQQRQRSFFHRYFASHNSGATLPGLVFIAKYFS
jgi:hypothetical protein